MKGVAKFAVENGTLCFCIENWSAYDRHHEGATQGKSHHTAKQLQARNCRFDMIPI